MDDKLYYVAVVFAFLLTLWLGWYAIIVLVSISIIIGVILTIKWKDRNGAVATLVLSVLSVIMVVISMMLRGCFNNNGPSYDTIERRTKIHTSNGDIMPTMHESGEYHNAGTGERQIEYGGSIEQKRDIEAADRLIENGY